MAKPVLYIHPVSQPSRACWAFCLANKLDVEVKEMDLMKGEHKQPEYLAINKSGNVPGLKDGDFSTGESHTILRYLAQKFKTPDNWYPADLKARAKVDEVLDWHHGAVRPGVRFFFYKYMAPVFGAPHNAERQEEGKQKYLAAIDFLEKNNLAKTKFVAGDAISIADLAIMGELGPMGLDDEIGPVMKEKPNVWRWYEEITGNDWYKETHKYPTQVITTKK
eukprot:TRINITY_DN45206_c0_g1_i1.p2 TRINITY_DN45206_c0_g1~~TRINITY_DN45206_c0_g1_i1.p2  ORF type:complete len:221 (+),score=96.24 TRINITY_DN45206_c0_g1_i1:79-741(+)